jgi:putative acyl-CoA dehydrogenase
METVLSVESPVAYDPRNVPIEAKKGATIGMSLTEKQGGGDVRANSTIAMPVSAQNSGNGDMFTLVGHKWFTSAPMSDAFLTLAQTEEHPNSPSCFLVPRWLPDGTKNKGFNIMRLKDKIGDRSNASSEVEYNDAYGFMIGEPGRGVPTIIEMVVHTRLDCTIGSAALMRHAAQQAAHHTSERKAFGARLIDQPVMRSVLADLAVESEAAVATWVRMAQAFDAGASASQEEHLFRRIATAVSKYWVCKRAPAMVFESLECFGGNGYVEEGPMARLFRQSPLNSIWEGSGNVISLDIVRALQKEEVGHAMVNELEKARGCDKHLDSLLDNIKDNIFKPMEVGPRYLADQLALALQANILLRDGNPKVAEAFCALRLRPDQRGWNVGAWGSSTLGEEHISVCIDRLRL